MSINFGCPLSGKHSLMSLDLLALNILSSCWCGTLTSIFCHCCFLALHNASLMATTWFMRLLPALTPLRAHSSSTCLLPPPASIPIPTSQLPVSRFAAFVYVCKYKKRRILTLNVQVSINIIYSSFILSFYSSNVNF